MSILDGFFIFISLVSSLLILYRLEKPERERRRLFMELQSAFYLSATRFFDSAFDELQKAGDE